MTGYEVPDANVRIERLSFSPAPLASPAGSGCVHPAGETFPPGPQDAAAEDAAPEVRAGTPQKTGARASRTGPAGQSLMS